MPPIKHALLGASSAARWIACPPSARLTESMEGGSSKYAEEGSRAHEVCEAHLRHCLKYWKAGRAAPVLGESIRLDGQPDDPAEMIRAANLYVDFLHGLWLGFASCPGVFIEQEVNVEQWVPGGFGTCDCLLIGDGVLHIVDFKYGQGVPVSCENNPQLMYYALGAYALFAATDEIQTVRMSIVQPRIQEEPETFEMPLADLLNWAEKTLQPAAMLAWEGKGNFAPGEKQCRFCKAYPTCRAWQDRYGDLAGFEPLPQLHSPTRNWVSGCGSWWDWLTMPVIWRSTRSRLCWTATRSPAGSWWKAAAPANGAIRTRLSGRCRLRALTKPCCTPAPPSPLLWQKR